MSDRRVILGLVGLEQQSVAVYELLAADRELGGRAGTAARLFLEHERRHLEALTQALRTAGGSPPPRPPRPRKPSGGAEALIRLALDHEERCIRAYHDAQASLKGPAVLATATGVMANEAQHLALLRQLLGTEPSPVAFVTGRS